jgi:hypothetical protein
MRKAGRRHRWKIDSPDERGFEDGKKFRPEGGPYAEPGRQDRAPQASATVVRAADNALAVCG